MDNTLGLGIAEQLCPECAIKIASRVKKRFNIKGKPTTRQSLKMGRQWKVIVEIILQETCDECKDKVVNAGKQYGEQQRK